MGSATVPWYWVATTVSATLTFIVVLILCTIHSYRFLSIFQSKKTDSKQIESRQIRLSGHFTYASIVSWLFMTTIWVILSFEFVMPGSVPAVACDIMTALIPTSYIIAKEFMYLVFVLRLQIIYKNSVHAYSNKSLIAFSVIFLGWNMCALITHFLTVKSEVVHGTCRGVYNPYMQIMVGSLDLICSVGFMVAFMIPLRKLINHETKSNSNKNKIRVVTDEQNKTDAIAPLIILALKAAILTSSACLTTLVAIIVGIAGFSGLFSGIDIVTNVLSLMLMTKHYSKGRLLSFDKLCCCMLLFYRMSLRLPKSSSMVLTMAMSNTYNTARTLDASTAIESTTQNSNKENAETA